MTVAGVARTEGFTKGLANWSKLQVCYLWDCSQPVANLIP